MKLSVTLCSVVGEIRTMYFPNSYLVPANVEMLLLPDDHVIVTAFLVFFFYVHSTALFCFVVWLKINFGLKTGNFKE